MSARWIFGKDKARTLAMPQNRFQGARQVYSLVGCHNGGMIVTPGHQEEAKDE